ncbi:hypothetical protein E1281_34595 [Actinomadura sp. KC345]|uniref:hypothetical protein n=1 Tax=Actinomadura sp. KC345 TaxID=2530371 RepID=UPI001043815D|nr:hypothetical protein [Actinomadura sp. KC345]TDC44017.1 hypothetical protein E1281_34595 [Actinomadura sp. KC345]
MIQRIQIWWTSSGRGSTEATVRGRLPRQFPLPQLADGHVLVHEVRMAEYQGYEPDESVRAYDALSGVDWLCLRQEGEAIRTERQPVWASYPVLRRTIRLGTLTDGQSFKYRANFRMSGYSIGWTFNEWTVNIAHEPVREDLFLNRTYDIERDDRVSRSMANLPHQDHKLVHRWQYTRGRHRGQPR